MKQKHPPPEGHDRNVEKADQRGPPPIERFRNLTRQLLGVTREQLREEEKKYERAKEKRSRSDKL